MVQTYHFFGGVCLQQPEALMESFLARDPDLLDPKTCAILSNVWAGQAPATYAKWLNSQTEPHIRTSANPGRGRW